MDCAEGGLVVGMEYPLLEKSAWDAGEPAGCDNILCAHCRAVVLIIDGRRVNRLGAPDEVEALYIKPEPDSPLLTGSAAGESFRTYVCRCQLQEVSGMRYLVDLELVSWRCGGHPA